MPTPKSKKFSRRADIALLLRCVMLCRLAVRRMIDPDTGQTEYILRVAGEHTLGSSGTVGSDQKTFSSEQELVGCLRALGVSEETIVRAEGSARNPASVLRFIGVAVDEQLPFSRIEDADFHLFDT